MRHRILLILWLIADVLIFLASYVAAYFLRVGFIFSTDFPFTHFIIAAALVAPVWLIVLLTTRTFVLLRSQVTLRNALYIVYAAAMGTALFSLTYYFLYGVFFSRLLLVEAFFLTVAGTFLSHAFFDWLKRMVLRGSHPTFPTLIIGANRDAARLITLLNAKKHPLKPVAILESRGTKETAIDGVPVKGKLNKLEDVLRNDRITHLIQCSDLEQSLNLLSACRQHGITYVLLPSVLGIVERDERVDSLEGQPVTIVEPKRRPWMWFFE